ncbi:TIGR03936 family radical SAM-associated protein [Geothrix sp. PMB-07]|uniref:TIGR03936 family radical SAM-associated protein n=1 Tax=Geothrix sp. PMB-07 TaxID=3068640 RepID=UPI002740EA9B|nr:TIGR03936 family radical SAM-associated protein [Geothrix sp. PMB-07]WLT33307.1 TIGR03936 family radical SAM-associated protein [Geothrix sp. PMB-07]
MRSAAHHPSIPAEALARQARLQAALQDMEDRGPSLEPKPLQRLRAVLEDSHAVDSESICAELQAAELVEEAVDLLRTFRRGSFDKNLMENFDALLSPLAAKARQRRSARWQLDTRRTRLRLQFSKLQEAIGFDDGDLHAIFLQAFRLEGMRLALDLAKRPRPLLSLGLSLQSGVSGAAENLDVVLKQDPQGDPATLTERLNHRLPEGLRIHRWDELPTCASDLLDLALRAHWRWPVPASQRLAVESALAGFLQAETWPWEREASKASASMDLRAFLLEVRWEEGALCFSTPLGAWQALNPLKALSAVLGLDFADIQGLMRTGFDLKPDPRLAQAERFEPKLKNMYEDAVLLGGGSNIILIDEDDEEPTRLG